MKVYVTKWTLGSDKGKVVAYQVRPYGEEYYDPIYHYGLFRKNREAFADKEAALADAERRRADKIASLERQIEKLKKMTFTCEE